MFDELFFIGNNFEVEFKILEIIFEIVAQKHPIIDSIIKETFFLHSLPENIPKVGVSGFLIKFQPNGILIKH